MYIKEEKGSTLLLKIFAILFGLFSIFGFAFLQTVDSNGNIASDFYMQLLYLVTLGVMASMGFMTIILITMEWGARRQPEERFGTAKGSTMPDFYRNSIAFINCLKIALAVLFCSMFYGYSRATLVFPISVVASLFLDGFVWNKRCREVNPNHKSLLLDVVNEFMGMFSSKRSRGNPVRHRQSFIFYLAATIFIVFCVHAVSIKTNPNFKRYRELSPENLAALALADSIISADLEARAKKQVPAKVKIKKRKVQKAAITTASPAPEQSNTEIPVAAAPLASSAPTASTTPATDEDEDEDWW